MDSQMTYENKKNISAIIHFSISLLSIFIPLSLIFAGRFFGSGNFSSVNDLRGMVAIFILVPIMVFIAGSNVVFGIIITILTITRKKKGLRLILFSEFLTIFALALPSLYLLLSK